MPAQVTVAPVACSAADAGSSRALWNRRRHRERVTTPATLPLLADMTT